MIDPVCGMEVEPTNAAGSHVYKGQTYFFCSQDCLAQFKEDPEKFLKSQPHEHHDHMQAAPHMHGHPGQAHGHDYAHATPEETDRVDHGTYVCPMDTEVRESRPGACPKCGMTLEPATPSAPSVKT